MNIIESREGGRSQEVKSSRRLYDLDYTPGNIAEVLDQQVGWSTDAQDFHPYFID